ncbi:glycoside hydrolase family 10 protein [Catenuloplanes atrovinosus]|uniref:Uncharacterized lipoprotein YddW (UPF0748 family) n=1 Tax=Catenuloplanes atrovinosus TaxID=137266 RepID=A0AAE4CFJ4_9ACTN|nr:family 10 glycosylhydrolase [Catenuloplanes atrovinosus]MDR7281054.1 uncharacterized lipoprotein YddW (UPF0748 family) [Catenuloplanes atrovinosus]
MPELTKPTRRQLLIGLTAGLSVLVVVATLGLIRWADDRSGSAAEAREPFGAATANASTAGSCNGVATSARRELRGMWIASVNNIDWPSRKGLPEAQVKAEYLGWLDLAQKLNHNAVFVHVRPSGDAFWPSEYAPWSDWLTGKRDGKSPGWDPLEWMIAETHARNLEFHAWFNPYRGSQPAAANGAGDDLDQLAPNHPLRAHPEWRVVYPSENGRFYFNPGIPEARAFVEDSMLEAVERYDVDGVHFDDFFYPYPEDDEDFPDDAAFAAHNRGITDKGDWRRDNVNLLVKEMSERIKQLKPWVKFGISPFGIWRNESTDPEGSASRGLQAYDEIYADTRKWVREGWLDYIVPQLYWNIGFERADYAALLPWWTKTVAGTGVQLWIGQADYRAGESGAWKEPDQLSKQLTLNRTHPEVTGSVHFSAKQLKADKLGSVTRYVKDHYATPALPAVMPQLPSTPPAAPMVTAAVRDPKTGAVTVTGRAADGTEPTSYALYRVDGSRATLVATARATGATDQQWIDASAPAAPTVTYCVTALDRSWNEGTPSVPITAG